MDTKMFCFYAICDAVRNKSQGNITQGEYETIIEEIQDTLAIAGIK